MTSYFFLCWSDFQDLPYEPVSAPEAQWIACWHGVPHVAAAASDIFNHKRGSSACSLLLSPSHRPSSYMFDCPDDLPMLWDRIE